MAENNETLDKKLFDTKTVKDVIDHITQGITPDHEKAFYKYEEFHKPEHQAHLYVNIVEPTIDEGYKTAINMLSGISDTDKVGAHQDRIKEVLMEYMQTILGKEHPHILGLIKELKGDDKLKVLAHYFDQFHVSGEKGIKLSALVQGLDQLKDTTIVEFKRELSEIKNQNKQGAMNYISSKAMQLYILPMPEGVYHGLLLDRLKKDGYSVKEPSKLANLLTLPVQQLHELHIGYLRREMERKRDLLEPYGLKKE